VADWIAANEAKFPQQMAAMQAQRNRYAAEAAPAKAASGEKAQTPSQLAGKGKEEPQSKPVPAKMAEHKPPCFKPGEELKSSWPGKPQALEKEFVTQLGAQEGGLNSMTVSEYLKNRDLFEAIGRGSGTAQAASRDRALSEIADSIKKGLNAKGIGGAQASEMALAKAKEAMSGLNALHNPDMIAGGADKISGFGSSAVNKSIGSQWKGKVAEMDQAAKDALSKVGPDAKMNVKLERCR
jgi:type VI secretion system secreted protein VgrG